jgi:hypothetical protein
MTQLKEAPPTGFHIFSGAHELGAVTGGASANDTQHEASAMVKATLLTSSSQPHRSERYHRE